MYQLGFVFLELIFASFCDDNVGAEKARGILGEFFYTYLWVFFFHVFLFSLIYLFEFFHDHNFVVAFSDDSNADNNYSFFVSILCFTYFVIFYFILLHFLLF